MKFEMENKEEYFKEITDELNLLNIKMNAINNALAYLINNDEVVYNCKEYIHELGVFSLVIRQISEKVNYLLIAAAIKDGKDCYGNARYNFFL